VSAGTRRIVQGARGHVDRFGRIGVRVRERRAAIAAEGPRDRRVEWKLAGSPFTKAKALRPNVTHATTGEAATRRHVWQWHTIVLDGVPEAS
jgi:hypothetical protein